MTDYVEWFKTNLEQLREGILEEIEPGEQRALVLRKIKAAEDGLDNCRDKSYEVPLTTNIRGHDEVIGTAVVTGNMFKAVIDRTDGDVSALISGSRNSGGSLHFSVISKPEIPVDSEGNIRFHKTY